MSNIIEFPNIKDRPVNLERTAEGIINHMEEYFIRRVMMMDAALEEYNEAFGGDDGDV